MKYKSWILVVLVLMALIFCLFMANKTSAQWGREGGGAGRNTIGTITLVDSIRSLGTVDSLGEITLIDSLRKVQLLDSLSQDLQLQLATPTGVDIYCNSKGDFVATVNNGAKTITLSSINAALGTVTANMVRRVVLIKVTTNVVSVIPLTTLAVAANVITLADAPANFATGDVAIVWLQGPDQALNKTTNSIINSNLNPAWSRYTTVASLVATQTLTGAFADVGAEIDVQGYKNLYVYLNLDINAATNVQLKALFKHTSAGAGEFTPDHSGFTCPNTTAPATQNYIEFDADADQLVVVTIPLENAVPYVQLQMLETDGGTDAIVVVDIVKGY